MDIAYTFQSIHNRCIQYAEEWYIDEHYQAADVIKLFHHSMENVVRDGERKPDEVTVLNEF